MGNASKHIGRRIGGKVAGRRMSDNRKWKSRDFRNSETDRSKEGEGQLANQDKKITQEGESSGLR